MADRFDAVLFDYDGTFADTGEGVFESIHYAVEQLGMKELSAAQLHRFVGPPLYDSFRKIAGMSDDDALLALEKYREYYSKTGIYRFTLYPGIIETVRALKDKGIKVGIATGKPEYFVSVLLDYMKITDLFDYVAGIRSDPSDETKADLILRAAKNMGVEPERVLMVGDRHFDINGARKAGTASAAALYGYGSREELEEAGADFFIDAPSDVLSLV